MKWITSVMTLLIGFSVQAQASKGLLILIVKNDRAEVTKALKLMNLAKPKLICFNLDLDDCNMDSVDKELRFTLEDTQPVLLPLKVHRAGKEFITVTGCSYFYPTGSYTPRFSAGFVNLVNSEFLENQAEKFQVSNRWGRTMIDRHMAVGIALALNPEKAGSFIKTNCDTVSIDVRTERKFKIVNLEDFSNGKENKAIIKDKVVIVGVAPSDEDYFIVREAKRGKFQKISGTSEIFANIACQIVGE